MKVIQGQGAQINPHNKFFKQQYKTEDEFLNYLVAEGEEEKVRVKTIPIHPKTVVNAVKSPDVGMKWSLNPYQGCEHGCVYCYARNSHEYWGYSAGVDFERTLLIKKEAPVLLDAMLRQKSWQGEPIVLSGNTDCYQPIERKFKITRQLIEVFLKHEHPMGIITKNALIQRDIDLLAQMAEKQLIHVVMSVTTLNEELRSKLEPRTASINKRLETIRALTDAGIPVKVMMAPIIPGLNSHEVFQVLKAVKEAGARDANYTMVRLNGQVSEIFATWLRSTYPDRAEKVLGQIKQVHGGALNDSRFGKRMKGDGKIAEQVRDSFRLARQRVFGMPDRVSLDASRYLARKQPQLRLF